MSKLEIPHQSYPWVISVAGIGAFMTTLDVGIINIALPYLKTAFKTNLTTIAWTITIYTLTLSASIILFGRLSDRVGRLKIFKIGVIIFGISSLACGFAITPWEIILFRAIQGIGASMIQATSVALITTLLPEEDHPRAIGTFGTLLGLGNILGASLGGIIISLLGWPWVFWINVPLCFFVLWGAFQFKCTFPKNAVKIDYVGISLIAVFTILFLSAIEWLAYPETRQNSLYAGVFCAVVFIIFALWERYTKNKLVDFKYFLNAQMGTLCLATIAFASSLSLYLIIPPLFLQKTTTLLPWQIGFITFCGPLGYVATSQFTGKLMQKFCSKHIMMIGEIIMLIGLIILSFISRDWDLYFFGSLLFLVGIGGGLLFSPNVASIMKQVPKHIQGTAGAYNRMIHNFGLSFGAAIAAMWIQLSVANNPSGFNIHGYRYVWVTGCVIVAISLLLLFLVKIKGSEQPDGEDTISLNAME